MSGFTEDGYVGRTDDELFETFVEEVEAAYGDDLEPYEGSFNRALLRGFSRAVSQNQEADLELLYMSLFVETAEGDELTNLAEGYGVDRNPAVAATGTVMWTRQGTTGEQVIPAGTVVTTELPEPVEYETISSATFLDGDSTVQANIVATEGGTDGNVGANRVTRIPSPPPNIQSATNDDPVGDPDYDLTDGTAQTLGQEQETDEELQNRVLEGASIGGAATVRAVRDKIRALDGNPSLTIYTNRTLNDNANGNNLPQLSSELIIYAPSVSDENVAQAIHEVIGVTERQVSGINGTSVAEVITDDVLNQDRTIEWSTPNEIALDITVDVVTEANYTGDDDVMNTIAEYIGGTLVDGSAVAGLDVAEDIVVDELELRINSIEGVVGIADLTLDRSEDGTDDTTTRSDGLTVIDIANNEVAIVDATSDIMIQ